MAPFLHIEETDGIVVLTMNRPDERNALATQDQFEEFVEAGAAINRSATAKVVILTGTGPAFSAGGNIKAMKARLDAGLDSLDAIAARYRAGIQQVMRAIHGIELPIIAAINGHAVGVGCDLACACDIRIAARQAKFAVSFVKLGLVPGDGGAWLLPRIVGARHAYELALVGDPIDAERALVIGLVNRVVDGDQVMGEARALAKKLLANPATAMRLTKKLLRESESASFDELLLRSAEYQAVAHHSPGHRAAVDAAIAARTRER